MKKFRKKPVEVEAIQLTRENANEVYDWLLTMDYGNDGVDQARIAQTLLEKR